jgi:DNA-cytosine methyltransferase
MEGGNLINVLSLFDGLAGARIALDQLGIECNYYASELDKYAIKVAKANYPDIIHLGDVRDVKGKDLPKIDLLIGGSPCQDLSIAKSNRKGLDGEKSGLFWDYVRLKEECKPRYFLLENVRSMPKSSRDMIRQALGIVSPIMINSALLTAQNRKRYYWTNTGVFMQPIDQGIVLADIIEYGLVDRIKSYALDACYAKGTDLLNYIKKKRRQIVFKGCAKRPYPRQEKSADKRTRKIETRSDDKSNAITTAWHDSLIGIYTVPRGFNKGGIKLTDKAPSITSSAYEQNNKLYTHEGIRKLTPLECERLQGIPEGYTNHASNTQRYKMIGNGFTVPVIKYILSHADFKANK